MGENANNGAASTNLSCNRARVYMYVNVHLHTRSVSMCMLDCVSVSERDKGSGARKLRGERQGEHKYIDTDAEKLLACGYDQAARLRIR